MAFKLKNKSPRFRALGDFSNIDSDVAAYSSRVSAAGGTISANSLNAISQFVAGCKADGIWTLLQDVGVFAGDDLASALVKLKSPATKPTSYTNVNYVSGDYTEATGIQGGVGKYLNSGVNLNDIGSATFTAAGYAREAITGTASSYLMGGGNGEGLFLGRLNGNNADSFAGGASAIYTSVTQASTAGFFAGSRVSSTDQRLYKNGTLIATNASANSNLGTTPASHNIYIAAYNLNSTSAIGVVFKKYSFACISSLLTDAQVALLYSRVQALQTSLNRQI